MKPIFILFVLIVFVCNLYSQSGTLDSSFGEKGSVVGDIPGENKAIALQSTGKIVVIGRNKNNNKLVRYNVDGTIDSSFGYKGYAILNYQIYGYSEFSDLQVTSNDELIAAGNANANVYLAKLTNDGKLDSTFGINGFVETNFGQRIGVDRIEIDTKGRIIVAATMTPDLIETSGFAARYLSDGKLDESFGSGGLTILPVADAVYCMGIQKDGKILVGGLGGYPDNQFYIARLNTNGSIDVTFGKGKGYVLTKFINNLSDEVKSLAIQPDGKIVAVGNCNMPELYQYKNIGVIRYQSDGELDSAFGVFGKILIEVQDYAEANKILLQKNGQIILTGRLFKYAINPNNNYSDLLLIRLNNNGSTDSSFGENGTSVTDIKNEGFDIIEDAVLQEDSRILTIGSTSFYNSFETLSCFNNDNLTRRQILIAKIRRWLQHHNGIVWDNMPGVKNYVVQRSADGVRWSTVYRSPITANSQSTVNYYNDSLPLPGTNYYRLQITSVDGAVAYSNVIAINNEPSTISLSPNPAKNVLRIEGLSLSSKVKITVVDLSGNVACSVQLMANSSSYNLNIAALKPGNYWLKTEVNGEVVTKQFVKE